MAQPIGIRPAELTLGNLALLDQGRIVEAFDQMLSDLTFDCTDRPLDMGARTLAMVVNLKPSEHVTGEVDVEFELTAKKPKSRSKKYTMTVKSKGGRKHGLAFRPDAADINPNGDPTLLDQAARNRAHGAEEEGD